ncbi:MAG: DUF927 domain-containing protein, partial [Acetobacteraceae bacterium]
DGLYRLGTPGRGEQTAAALWVCAPFEVLGRAHTDHGGWSLVLRWTDPAGGVQTRLIRRAALQKEPRDLAASLEDDGLRCNVAAAARVALVEYLSRLAPARIIQAVNRTGWHEGARGAAYVLPDGATFGAEGHDVMLRPDLVERGALAGTRGTLAEWNAHVARYAVGNARVAFAIGAAFAAPLLHLTSTDSGRFHLRGAAQSGKSTTLFAAASVTGLGSRAGLVRSWRAARNVEPHAGATHAGCRPH